MNNQIEEADILEILGLSDSEFFKCISSVTKVDTDDIEFCVKSTNSRKNKIPYWNISYKNNLDFYNSDKEILKIQINKNIKKYCILLENYNSIKKSKFIISNSNKNIDRYFDRGHILGNWVTKCESVKQLLAKNPQFFKKNNPLNIVKQFKYANSVLQKHFEDKARTKIQNTSSKVYYEVAAVFKNQDDRLPIGMYMSYRDVKSNNYKFRVFFPNMAKVEAYSKEYNARNTYANESIGGMNLNLLDKV